jgi:hypothetical protein
VKYTILGAIFGGINISVCNIGRQISKPAVFCRRARRTMPTRFYPLPNRAYRCHPCHPCRCYRVPFRVVSCPSFRSVPCLVPVPFRAVSNALTMPCRAVPNFLKAGHDTVKTRAQNSTIPVPVPCLNPFRFQPCSYRSVSFSATTCLNLEHCLQSKVVCVGYATLCCASLFFCKKSRQALCCLLRTS